MGHWEDHQSLASRSKSLHHYAYSAAQLFATGASLPCQISLTSHCCQLLPKLSANPMVELLTSSLTVLPALDLYSLYHANPTRLHPQVQALAASATSWEPPGPGTPHSHCRSAALTAEVAHEPPVPGRLQALWHQTNHGLSASVNALSRCQREASCTTDQGTQLDVQKNTLGQGTPTPTKGSAGVHTHARKICVDNKPRVGTSTARKPMEAAISMSPTRLDSTKFEGHHLSPCEPIRGSLSQHGMVHVGLAQTQIVSSRAHLISRGETPGKRREATCLLSQVVACWEFRREDGEDGSAQHREGA